MVTEGKSEALPGGGGDHKTPNATSKNKSQTGRTPAVQKFDVKAAIVSFLVAIIMALGNVIAACCQSHAKSLVDCTWRDLYDAITIHWFALVLLMIFELVTVMAILWVPTAVKKARSRSVNSSRRNASNKPGSTATTAEQQGGKTPSTSSTRRKRSTRGHFRARFADALKRMSRPVRIPWRIHHPVAFVLWIMLHVFFCASILHEGRPVILYIAAEPSLRPVLDREVSEYNEDRHNPFNPERRYEVRVRYGGSGAVHQSLLWGHTPIAGWFVIDSYWHYRTADGSRDAINVSHVVPDHVTPLCTTNLCFLIRSDRAQYFVSAMHTPKYHSHTWLLLRDLALYGWAITGHPELGRAIFVHTNPGLSNSGHLALALLLHEYTSEHHIGPGFMDAGYIKTHSAEKGKLEWYRDDFTQNWLVPIEQRVSSWPATTAFVVPEYKYGNDDRLGGQLPDIGIAYSVNAVADAMVGTGGYTVVTPSRGVVLSLTAAALTVSDDVGPRVSPAQHAGVVEFIDYMRDKRQQEALRAGGWGLMKDPGDGTAVATASPVGDANGIGYPFPHKYLNDLTYLWCLCSTRHRFDPPVDRVAGGPPGGDHADGPAPS